MGVRIAARDDLKDCAANVGFSLSTRTKRTGTKAKDSRTDTIEMSGCLAGWLKPPTKEDREAGALYRPISAGTYCE